MGTEVFRDRKQHTQSLDLTRVGAAAGEASAALGLHAAVGLSPGGAQPDQGQTTGPGAPSLGLCMPLSTSSATLLCEMDATHNQTSCPSGEESNPRSASVWHVFSAPCTVLDVRSTHVSSGARTPVPRGLSPSEPHGASRGRQAAPDHRAYRGGRRAGFGGGRGALWRWGLGWH